MKKKLMILSLVMLGCSGQVQAMSALKQGMQNATRVCGQWIKNNPGKASVAVAAPFCLDYYQKNKHGLNSCLENMKFIEDVTDLTPKTKAEILNLFKQHGFENVRIKKGFELEVWPYNGEVVLCMSARDVKESNDYIEGTSVAYSNSINGMLLHEVGHAVHNDTGNKFIFDVALHSLFLMASSGIGAQLMSTSKLGLKSKIAAMAVVIPSLYMAHSIGNKVAMSAISRRCEKNADVFAANELIKAKDMFTLKLLARDFRFMANVQNKEEASFFDEKHPLYESHPSLLERAELFEQKVAELKKQLAEESEV